VALRAIWAQAHGAAIGASGGMPWHLPEDLAHFKAETVGSPVVMGRRTWESFPERFRPLPGRENIVITRDAEYDAPGAAIAPSLEEALERARAGGRDAWVIGGASVYAEAMPLLDELVVTEIDVDVDADAFAPEVGEGWRASSVDPPSGWHASRTGTRYRFIRYTRER